MYLLYSFCVILLAGLVCSQEEDEDICFLGVTWGGFMAIHYLNRGAHRDLDVSFPDISGPPEFHSITRDKSSGIYYIVGTRFQNDPTVITPTLGPFDTTVLWSYNPCNGAISVNPIRLGVINPTLGRLTTISYNPNDGLLYSLSSVGRYYSINPNTLEATLITTVGDDSPFSLGFPDPFFEFDNNGVLYSILFSLGLVTVNETNLEIIDVIGGESNDGTLLTDIRLRYGGM